MATAKDSYPLHRLVWRNQPEALDELLKTGDHDKDELDPRSR